MRFLFSRHPELLLSVSPLLDGYLTVAAGFLIAHVFLSASSFLTSVFAGGFMAGTFLGSLLIGRFADRYGRSIFCRTLLVVPAIVAGAACFTDNLVAVTLLQCLISLFIGADQPVSQAIVTELSAPEKRSKRLSFLMLAGTSAPSRPSRRNSFCFLRQRSKRVHGMRFMPYPSAFVL